MNSQNRAKKAKKKTCFNLEPSYTTHPFRVCPERAGGGVILL